MFEQQFHDVNIKLLPSEDTDSLESWNCNVGLPFPLSSNNNPVS